jgi:hypothetical protein
VTDGLEQLLSHPALWRATGPYSGGATLPTGFRRLDERLPGGGWPLATLVELLVAAPGTGELRLLMPALRACMSSRGMPARWIAWLGPPHVPYAPALVNAGLDPAHMLVVRPRAGEDVPWAMEQALRSGACAVVLGWIKEEKGTEGKGTDLFFPRNARHAGGQQEKNKSVPFSSGFSSLRRLKLAAEEGGSLGVLFRHPRCRDESSPAALRLLLEPRGHCLDVEILKSRGGSPGRIPDVFGAA